MPAKRATMLGCPARFVGDWVYLTVEDAPHEAKLRRDYAERLEEAYSGEVLRWRPGGHNRYYLRFRCSGQAAENVAVARIIAGWHYGSLLEHQQVHYNDGDRLNLDPENLVIGPPGHNRATDRTFQDAGKREYRNRGRIEGRKGDQI